MPRLVPCLSVGLLACLLGMAVPAQAQPQPVPGIPIEGVLVNWGGYYMEGASENWAWLPPYVQMADVSPDGDWLVHNSYRDTSWPTTGDIYVSQIDDMTGATWLDLSESIGGTNCIARWSPDGSHIVFQHSDIPTWVDGGPYPCDEWEVWTVKPDGSDLSPLVSTAMGGGAYPSFSPNGYRIVYEGQYSTINLIDIDGSDQETIVGPGYPLNWGGKPAWSPNGLKLALEYGEPGEVASSPGSWRQILTIDSDGSNPQLVVERFRPDDIVDENMHYWSGPASARWSPLGDRIAFVGMDVIGDEGHDLYLPWFWPSTLDLWGANQTEMYLIEVATGVVTRLTDDDDFSDRGCYWNGPNTAPDNPEVTVDNTTVTFTDVTGEGLTTIIRDDDPPALPADYQFCGEYYNIDTTADYTPPITICMTYEDEDVPGGNEEALCLLHYNEVTEEYEDITTSKDTEANIVCGQTDSLSAFGLAAMPIFGGFRPPINADGTSEWKAGRTIPVKFAIADPSGSPITNAVCHLSVYGPLLEAVGEGVLETAEAASADVGDTFRYCGEGEQYIYNLSTKGWEPGAYLLEVSVEGWPGFTPSVRIGLR